MLKLLGILAVIATCGLTVEGASCVGKCPSHAPVDGPITFLPHEDCNMYCVCNFGKPIEMPCPPDLHFSTKWNVCVDPAIAECTGNKPESLMETLQNIQEEEEEEEEQLTLIGNIKDDSCIGMCPSVEDPREAVLLAHDDCMKYCHCKRGRPIVKDCPRGLLFSPDEAMCVSPKESRCTGYNAYVPTTPRPVVDDAIAKGCITKCPANYIALIVHRDCTKYCHCANGKAVVRNCPKDLHFSSDEGRCVAQNVALCDGINGYGPPNCIGTCPVHQEPDYIILLPHDECTKYCRCKNGKMIIRFCRAGTHFSMSLGMCTKPEEAECTGIGAINGHEIMGNSPLMSLFN